VRFLRIRREKILLFVVLSFFYSWILLLFFHLAGGQWGQFPLTHIVGVLYMFGPAAAALTAQRAFGDKLFTPFGISFKINRWFVAAWLIPVVLALLSTAIAVYLPFASFSTDPGVIVEHIARLIPDQQIDMIDQQIEQLPIHPAPMLLLQGLLGGITINAVAAFGEELGWRGFLLRELRFVNFWRSNLIIGILWGLWHTPLILLGHNYPSNPILGVLMMVALTVLMSPILSYVTIRARSVIAAAILHGTFNAMAGVALVFVSGGSDLTVGLTGLSGILALILANILLILYDRNIAKYSLI